jgi:UDP-N-acetylglucosamine 3-dehydrogenase
MKVAIWGAGKMGQVHGQAYKGMGKDVEIAYIVERDAGKAAEFSGRFQCRAIDDVSGLEGKHIDMIDICLPTYLHREAIERALDLCDYIFCEKPVCLTRDDYYGLCRIADTKTCHLMVGQVLRFWNGYVRAREMVLNGEIGRPRLITCFRRQKMPSWSKGNWLMDNRQSGGLLMDLCIHDIDYLYWLLGTPEQVSCKIVEREETTLHGILNIVYSDCCANVVGSWGMPEGFHDGGLESMLEIVGDIGMITYSGGDCLELIRGNEKQCISLEHEDGYEEELKYFVECVKCQKEPEQSNLFSVEGTMKILWAAKEAADSRQFISIDARQLCKQ